MHDQVSMLCVIGHPRQAVLISAGSVKRHEVQSWTHWRCRPSKCTILNDFHQVLPLIGLLWNNTCQNSTSDFIEGVCNMQCPSNPNTWTASTSSDADQLFIFLRIFFTPHYCKQTIFHFLWSFIFKICCFVALEQRNRWKCNPFLEKILWKYFANDFSMKIHCKYFQVIFSNLWYKKIMSYINNIDYIFASSLVYMCVCVHAHTDGYKGDQRVKLNSQTKF